MSTTTTGSGSSTKTTTSKTISTTKKSGSSGGLLSGIGSYVPSKADMSRAQNIIDAMYNPQIGELKRQQGQVGTDYQRMAGDLQAQLNQGVQTEQGYGNIGDKRLQDIYNQLQQSLQQNVGAIGDIYSKGKGNIAQAYNEALGNQQGQGSDVMQQLQAEAQRLGIGAATPESLARVQNTLQQYTGRTQREKAGSIANIETLGTQRQAIGQQAVGAAGQEGAQRRANLLDATQKAIADLQNTYAKGRVDLARSTSDNLKELGGKLTDLLGARGKDLEEQIHKIFDARTAAERQAAMDAAQIALQRSAQSLEQQKFAYAKSQDAAAAKKAAAANVNPYQRLQDWMNGKGAGKQAATYTAGPRFQHGVLTVLNGNEDNEAVARSQGQAYAKQNGLNPQMMDLAITQFFHGGMKPNDFGYRPGAAPVGGGSTRDEGNYIVQGSRLLNVPSAPTAGSKPAAAGVKPAGKKHPMSGGYYYMLSADGKNRFVYNSKGKLVSSETLQFLNQG